MTIDDVRAEVERVRECASDNEAAHGIEDQLYVDVLQAIADGTAEDAPAMARLALTAADIDFQRWYA